MSHPDGDPEEDWQVGESPCNKKKEKKRKRSMHGCVCVSDNYMSTHSNSLYVHVYAYRIYVWANINEGVHKHMLLPVCVCLCVCTQLYVCPMGRQLALGCFYLSSCRVGRVAICIIRETPQGIVDSINPVRRRAFLIPHHTPPNSHSYQPAETILMA